MMEIIAVCRSRKKSRGAVASTLDKYLFRIGDRTWRGRASGDALKRISAELRKKATRHTAVAVYRSGSKEANQRPVFIVGSKAMFSDDGRAPIAVRRQAARATASPYDGILRAIVEISALFHDAGKATRLFQDKIKAAAQGAPARADAVRHEVYSTLFLAHVIGKANSAVDVARRIGEAASSPSCFEEAARYAADKCFDIHETKSGGMEILLPQELGPEGSARRLLLLLVLSHHRLAKIDTDRDLVQAENHFSFSAALRREEMELAEGAPFWLEDWFTGRLEKCADILAGFEGEALPSGLDLYARLPLMLSDHLGSGDKEQGALEGHLANTIRREGPAGDVETFPGDSLSRHVWRVARNARPVTAGILRHGQEYPSLCDEDLPGAVAAPEYRGDRFDWQADMARVVGEIEPMEGAGCFGVIIAGTGAGKTRGAAIGMAAMEKIGGGRGMRYNLALPLRTLTRQSGKEYIEDLGFRPDEVATFVGGQKTPWKKDPDLVGEEEATGSEDRLLELLAAEVETFDGEDLDIQLGALGGEVDRSLPAYAQRICMTAAGPAAQAKAERFLKTPVLVSTIDHLMPAASPLKGGHISAMMRVMSSDLVIDEIDLLEPEDISAVGRLVRLAGLAGRNVLIMSATLPRDVVSFLHDTYTRAFGQYARIMGREPALRHFCAGDVVGSCKTSAGQGSIEEAYDACVAALASERTAAGAIHKATILPSVGDWKSLVACISHTADKLHRDQAIALDGFDVSCGLVRMTRVKHLQSIACGMPGQGRAGAYREYVVLHSGLPRPQRENIERVLKQALTRKGADPDAGLRAFLKDRGVFERARAAGAQDIQLIVLSSPVIETGNDVDFDWLIADPSSIRSVIQAAGRVNRHRRRPVTSPNIGILADYCVSRTEGAMRAPGVETRPAVETGVKQIAIKGSRSMRDLVSKAPSFRVDASMVMEAPVALAELECEARVRFLSLGAEDFKDDSFFWSSASGTRHQFRRSIDNEIEAYPVPEGVLRSWCCFPSARSRRTVPVRLREPGRSQMTAKTAISETLDDLLGMLTGVHDARPVKGCPVAVPIGAADGNVVVLDPVLGIIRGGEEVEPDLLLAF